MAEIFGVAAGAASVAALFSECVDCFEYIQLGRHFGQDYESSRLKLDIAQARLSRWGAAVAVYDDSRFATTPPPDASTQLAHSILEEIGSLFQSAQKTSKRYALGANSDALAVWQDGDLQPVAQQVHQHLAQTIRRRQKQTSLAKKTAWALYDGKRFAQLVDQIAGFVDELEKLWPVEAACRRLARADIEDVHGEAPLAAIRDVGEGVDQVLVEAAKQKGMELAGKNHAGQIGTQDEARVRIGHEFAASFGGLATVDHTTNTTDSIDAKNQSRVHIGTSYGGAGIFE